MMQVAHLPRLLHVAHRISEGTRRRLERSFIHALRGHRHTSAEALRTAVGDASLELQAAGLGDQAVLDVLSALVEDTGRACGADRPSLISGEMRWVPVRDRVLQLAREALDPVYMRST